MIVKDTDMIKVENLSDLQCGYVLISNGATRRFGPHVHRDIPAGELRELYLQHGGPYLLQNYLRVYNKELAEEFGVSDDAYDHEYSWTTRDVDNCLNNDDIDVLLDALDFAPQGIIDSLKERAVELEIPDKRKLEAIGKKTNSNLEAMIRNKHAYDTDDDAKDDTPKRRRKSDDVPMRRRRA